MRHASIFAGLCLASLLATAPVNAEKFTYQGRVSLPGGAASGTISIQAELFDDATAGSPTGTPASNQIIDVPVRNNLFTVELDFGDAFDGSDRWLEISLDEDGSANGDTFSTLSPRIEITSVPTAAFARRAGVADSAINDLVDDADADPTNELIDRVVLNGTNLSINENGTTYTVDLSSLSGAPDGDGDSSNELNTGVSFDGSILTISDAGGNRTVNLSSLGPDSDADPNNELNQSFQLVGSQLRLQDAGGTLSVDLSSISSAPPTGTSSNIIANDIEETIFGEVGTINVTQVDRTTSFSVPLQNTYTDPIVILNLLEDGDPNPANIDSTTLRVLSRTSNSFTFEIQEWNYLDGSRLPGPDRVSYMVVESGFYDLPNGLQMEAGRVRAGGSTNFVFFDESFPSTPVVLAQVMSKVEATPVVPYMDYVDNSSAFIGVLEEEAEDGNHPLETIGYVAISADYQGKFGLLDSETGTLQSTDALTSRSFAMPFDNTPAFFSTRRTRAGNDTSYSRTQSLTNDSFAVLIQEEASGDMEFAHAAVETVGFLAIEPGDLGIYSAGELILADGTVFFPDDADPDPTNELNTRVELVGQSLEVEDNGGTLSTDLSPLVDELGDGHSLDRSDESAKDVVFVQDDGDVLVGGYFLDQFAEGLNSEASGSSLISQTFVPEIEGSLIRVGIYLDPRTTASRGIFRIAEGDSLSNELYSQTFDITPGTAGWVEFDIEVPTPLTPGIQHSLWFGPDSSGILYYRASQPGDYPNGDAFAFIDVDLAFRTYMRTSEARLGILTDEPTSELDVNGKIKATNLHVTKLVKTHELMATGTVTAASFVGDGSGLSNIDVDASDDFNTEFSLVGSVLSIGDADGTLTVDLDNLPNDLLGDFHSLDASDGLPADAVYVDSIGHTGVGTRSPQAQLHIGTDGILSTSDVTLIGNNPASILSGGSRDAIIVGNFFYLLEGGRFAIFDFSNPQSIVLRDVFTSFDVMEHLWIEGGRAYILRDTDLPNDTLEIFDVSNPDNITHLSSFDGSSISSGFLSNSNIVAAKGDNVFISARGLSSEGVDDRLIVLDVTNPTAVSEVGTFEFPALNFFTARDVQIINNSLIMSENDEFIIMDIQNPAAPTVLSKKTATNFGVPELRGSFLDVQGSIALVGGSDLISLIDISNKSNPVLLSQTTLSGFGFIDSVSIDGNLAAAAASSEIYMYDISNPASPVELGILDDDNEGLFTTLRGVNFVDIAGSNMYSYSSDGFSVFQLDIQPDRTELLVNRSAEIGSNLLVGKDLTVNGAIQGPVNIANQGNGATLVNLQSERPWSIRQLGTGSSAHLELFNSTDKNLIINNGTGRVGIGTTQPGNPFTVVADVPGEVSSGSGTGNENPENYVVRFRNTSQVGEGGDQGNTYSGEETGVLALIFDRNLNAPSETSKFNWIQFFEGDNGDGTYGIAGAIENNEQGNVQYESNSADYAERLERLYPNEDINTGDVVGVFGGKVSKRTEGADWAMAVSGNAAVLGNATLNDNELRERMEIVGFIGQVPIWVTGTVEKGDYLIASGNNDGTAIAVSPNAIRPDQSNMIVGRAWESSADQQIKKINAVVGLPQSKDMTGALLDIVTDQQRQIDELRMKLENYEKLNQRLTDIEKSLNNDMAIYSNQ